MSFKKSIHSKKQKNITFLMRYVTNKNAIHVHKFNIRKGEIKIFIGKAGADIYHLWTISNKPRKYI